MLVPSIEVQVKPFFRMDPYKELLYYGRNHFSVFSDTVKYLITKLQEFLFSNILANTRYSHSLILTHDCLLMCLAVILSFPFAICVFTSLPSFVNLTQFILLQAPYPHT